MIYILGIAIIAIIVYAIFYALFAAVAGVVLMRLAVFVGIGLLVWWYYKLIIKLSDKTANWRENFWGKVDKKLHTNIFKKLFK